MAHVTIFFRRVHFSKISVFESLDNRFRKSIQHIPNSSAFHLLFFKLVLSSVVLSPIEIISVKNFIGLDPIMISQGRKEISALEFRIPRESTGIISYKLEKLLIDTRCIYLFLNHQSDSGPICHRS
jgi:hypothetical protein